MQRPVVRAHRAAASADDRRPAARCSPGTTCSATFPGLIGVKTGHTSRRGLVAGRRGRAEPALTLYATILGSPTRGAAERRPRRAARLGLSPLPAGRAVDRPRASTRSAETGYDRPAVPLVAPRDLLRIVRVDRPLVERVVAPASRRAARAPRAAARRGAGLRRTEARRRARRSSPAAAVDEPGSGLASAGWYAGPHARPSSGACSRDRHRHAQRRARPHADRAELPARPPPSREREPHARRRQGHQRRARAQAPRRAGRRDRPRRRPHRHADRRGADRRGDPQRLRPHQGASRARRRRSSIRRSTRTPRSTSGARAVSPGELEILLEKLRYLVARRGLRRLRRLAAARGRRGLLRRGDPRPEPPRRPHRARHRGPPAAARRRGRAELVSPNQREAEQLVGQEFEDDDDFLHGARRDRRDAARGTC